ncbi:MAG: DUF3857 domain-containing protein [FCB group bacterium]|nr:DUF3857 domain-containing protein [FCB group bacterium]
MIRRLIIPFLLIVTVHEYMRASESHILFSTIKTKIKSEKKMEYTVHKKIFITDNKGREFSEVSIVTDDFSILKKFKAKMMDLNGKSIRTYKLKDLESVNASSSGMLYTGNRIQYGKFSPALKEYIFEYEYTIQFSSTYFLRDWYPQTTIPVQNATYSLTIPKNFEFNYYQSNNIPPPTISDDGRTYNWKVNDLPPQTTGWRIPPEIDEEYEVILVPGIVELNGIKGRFRSWATIGGWYNQLSESKYNLETQVISIDYADSSQFSITDQVYRFLQGDTRYVGIEFGIHGWEPHSAQSVCDNKYGDCKDLTTYFISLLKQQSIIGYPVLLRTRDRGIINPTRPNNYFNHVITMVPMEQDTLWVDATSKTATISDLPWTDEGVTALAIVDGKGELVKTPLSSPGDNQETYSIRSTITLAGDMDIKGRITYTENRAHSMRYRLKSYNSHELEKYLKSHFSSYAPEITNFEFTVENLGDLNRPLIVDFSFQLIAYATRIGSRFIINPSFIHRAVYDNLESTEERKCPVFYQFPFTLSDSIYFRYPRSFQLSTSSDPILIDTNFGTYRWSMEEIDDHELLFIRTYIIKKQLIDLKDYSAYYDFCRKAQISDKGKMILKIID